MRKEKISKAVNNIQSKYIEDAEEYIAKRKKFNLRTVYIKSLIAAACVCAVISMMLLSGGSGTIFYKGENYLDMPNYTPSSDVVHKPDTEKYNVLDSIYVPGVKDLKYSYEEDMLTIYDNFTGKRVRIYINKVDNEPTVPEISSDKTVWEYVYDSKYRLVRSIIPLTRSKSEHADEIPGFYMCSYNSDQKVSEIKLYIQGDDNKNHLVATTSYMYYDGDQCITSQRLEEITDMSHYAYNINRYYIDEYGLLYGVHYNDNKYETSNIFGETKCCEGDSYFNVNLETNHSLSYYIRSNHENSESTYILNESGEDIEYTKILEAYDGSGNLYVIKDFQSVFDDKMVMDAKGNILPYYICRRSDEDFYLCVYFMDKHTIDDHCEPEYDENGRLFRCTHNHENGTKSVCVFNSFGQKTKEFTYLWLDLGSENYITTTYSYTDSGRLESLNISSSSDTVNREYIFDDSGRVCQMKKEEHGYTDSKGAVLYMEFDEYGNSYMKKWEFMYDKELKSLEYLYDENYALTGRIYVHKENEQGGYYTEIYDASGRKISEKLYDSDGELCGNKEFVYNERGWLIREDTYDENGVLEEYTKYIRGAVGEIADTVSGLGTNMSSKSEFRSIFNSSGTLLRKIEICENGNIYVYNYDSRGAVTSVDSDAEGLGARIHTFREASKEEYERYSKFDIEDLVNLYMFKETQPVVISEELSVDVREDGSFKITYAYPFYKYNYDHHAIVIDIFKKGDIDLQIGDLYKDATAAPIMFWDVSFDPDTIEYPDPEYRWPKKPFIPEERKNELTDDNMLKPGKYCVYLREYNIILGPVEFEIPAS